ncbi:MAG: prolyl aminopeptidase, partial [Halobacteriales archaeon]|nr:prolyl aminopeptidase [Halobacteriales archaeon]
YFPPIEPHDHGMLDVGDGHRIYWEIVGNPSGSPVVFLHGGPGSGASPGQRRLFDPERYRAVIFDQRGSGRSRPLADDSSTDLSTNTTPDLIADIERLRSHLAIEAWTVVGFSWGTTLALAYATAHAERVTGMVLGLVGLTTRREVTWLTEGVGRLFPEQWTRFVEAVPGPFERMPLVDAYAEMLQGADPALRDHAAREWCAWEDAHVSLGPNSRPSPAFDDPAFRYRFALVVTHYWRNAAFLDEHELWQGIERLGDTPGHLIHGRYDVSSPLETPWRIARVWPGATLTVLDDIGHGDGDSFPTAVISALADLG